MDALFYELIVQYILEPGSNATSNCVWFIS